MDSVVTGQSIPFGLQTVTPSLFSYFCSGVYPHKFLVEDSGIEPLTEACKATVFPIIPIPRITFLVYVTAFYVLQLVYNIISIVSSTIP